jgi:hypothetical protein
VNLRKDHYRVHALTGRSPTLEYYTLVALAGRGNTTGFGLCRACQRKQTLFLVMSEYYIIVKTFNNGSLGSGIDEERSEMR